MTQFDPKSIFGTRAGNYIRYRPGYPVSVVDTLRAECGLSSSWRVADIGSGTGLLARLFLDLGCAVYGVEPNEEMRMAGEKILAGSSRFTSVPGSAEADWTQGIQRGIGKCRDGFPLVRFHPHAIGIPTHFNSWRMGRSGMEPDAAWS